MFIIQIQYTNRQILVDCPNDLLCTNTLCFLHNLLLSCSFDILSVPAIFFFAEKNLRNAILSLSLSFALAFHLGKVPRLRAWALQAGSTAARQKRPSRIGSHLDRLQIEDTVRLSTLGAQTSESRKLLLYQVASVQTIRPAEQ